MAPMVSDFLLSAAATLLVTIDPPGLAAIFIAVTQGMTRSQQQQVAIRASVIAFAILATFSLVGQSLLQALGIGFPAFRIAGGLLLFAIAFEMIFQLRSRRDQEQATEAITIDHVRNVAAFPLAIPVMAGPGAITATLLLAGRSGRDPVMLGLFIGILLAVILICLVVLLMAERISRLLGVTGKAVFSRLLGVILAALAVQFVIDGVLAVIRSAGATP